MKTVNILGTEYTFRVDDLNNPELETADGLCRVLDKEIVVRKKECMRCQSDVADERRMDHVIRHELVHAVAQECGVQYGNDEALVDWIAHIIPVVNKAFEQIKETGE